MSTLGIELERTNSYTHLVELTGNETTNLPVSDDFSTLFSGLESRRNFTLDYDDTQVTNQYHYDNDDDMVDCSSENEMEDELPNYECTLYKKDFVQIKHEVDATGVYCNDRKWNQVLLTVEGTKVTADYGTNSKRRPSLLASLGMSFSQAEAPKNTKSLPSYTQDIKLEGAILLPAEEYAYTKPYTFRVILASGKQFLIRSDSVESALDWVETLRSVISISSDLDARREPQFTIQSIIYDPHPI